jgi:hypothetical protein
MRVVQMKPVWPLFWTEVYRPLEIAPTDVEAGFTLMQLLMGTFGATYRLYLQDGQIS